MNKELSNTSKTAIGGMAVTLSVIIMLPTVLDMMSMALPAIAGLITLFCIIELGKKWAFGVFLATSFLGTILLPNKEAIVYYIAFFGYYPILKALIESKNMNRVLEYILKLVVFNASFVLAFWFLSKIMGVPISEILEIDQSKWWSSYVIPAFIVVGNLFFFIYDVLFLRRYATVYIRLWQKKFRKLFRFK